MSQVPDWQIGLSYWYVTHKPQIKKILTAALILIDLVVFIWLIWQAVFLVIAEREYEKFAGTFSQNLIDYAGYNAKHSPQALRFGAPQLLGGNNGRYDLAIEVQNPNVEWQAYLVYKFSVNGVALAQQEAFVLPEQNKILLKLGAEMTNPSNLNFSIVQLNWKRRINAAKEKDSYLNFKISQPEISSFNLGADLKRTSVNFSVANKTVYSFWDVRFIVKLYSGGSLVGVNYAQASQFVSGQTKDLEVGWTDSLPAGLSAEVVPDIDIYNESIYYQPLAPAAQY